MVACLGTVMVAAMADLMVGKWVVPQAACLAVLWAAPMVDKMVWRLAVSMVALLVACLGTVMVAAKAGVKAGK